jgi:hypothetical protein
MGSSNVIRKFKDVEVSGMNVQGAAIGLIAFVIIGVFHPIVVKAEYYFGLRVWPVFLTVGIGCIAGSIFIGQVLLSALLGIFGFASLWSIRELHEQVEKVKKGWFPKNPNRRREYMSRLRM